MRGLVAMLLCATLACSCKTVPIVVSPDFSPRPQQHTIALSELAGTTIEYDSSRYKGLNLEITNDLGSDIFWMYVSQSNLETKPVARQCPIPLPHQTLKDHPVFVFITSGNSRHIFTYHASSKVSPRLSRKKRYCPVMYYHCGKKAFYVDSFALVEAGDKEE